MVHRTLAFPLGKRSDVRVLNDSPVDCQTPSVHTACGILPGEDMIVLFSTISVILAYISPSGKHEPQREVALERSDNDG